MPMDKATEKKDQPVNTLLALPTELLVYIISFLTMAQDKITLRYVSLRLQRITSETPSLWREFMWPYYHTGDENRVNKVLKVCGRYVKRLSFLDYVREDKLIGMLGNCSNLIYLRLPETRLSAKALEAVLLQLKHLQRLDVRWCDRDIKQLLELLNDTNLKKLTIRLDFVYYENTGHASWMHYWLLKKFSPQQLNFVTYKFYFNQLYKMYSELWAFWVAFNFKSPVGHAGQIKLYSNLNSPMNWSLPLPLLQLDFGQTAVSPYVSASNFGLQSDLLILTDYTCGSKVVHKAAIKDMHDEVKVARGKINHGITNLKFVTEFIALYGGSFCSEQLEQLAIACPNLHRLGLQGNKNCLKVLQGLRTIVYSCHNLQGLDISDIPIEEVDDQMVLWGILSDMKLTHLAVDFCIIIPTIENKEKLNTLFQKFVSLRSLEPNCICSTCCKGVEKSISVLSYFTSLIHCITSIGADHSTTFPEVFNSCKELKCLSYTGTRLNQDLSSLMPCRNLQQLRINLCGTHLSYSFLATISAHGKLVYVVFCVKSMSSEGITTLIRNSPELMTFHCLVYNEIVNCEGIEVNPDILKSRLKYKYSQRQLFVRGSCILIEYDSCEDDIHSILGRVTESDTNLFSFWDVYYSRNI